MTEFPNSGEFFSRYSGKRNPQFFTVRYLRIHHTHSLIHCFWPQLNFLTFPEHPGSRRMRQRLVVCNSQRPSLFRSPPPPTTTGTRPVCLSCRNVVRLSLSKSTISLHHLPFRAFSVMKLTTDHSTLGRIILAVGALSFLPSVEAAFATCTAGWEWVRRYMFLAVFESNPFAFSVIQFQRRKSL